jgi:hypothetical protein
MCASKCAGIPMASIPTLARETEQDVMQMNVRVWLSVSRATTQLLSKYEHCAPHWDRPPLSFQVFHNEYSKLCDELSIFNNNKKNIMSLLWSAPKQDIHYMWKMYSINPKVRADWNKYHGILIETIQVQPYVYDTPRLTSKILSVTFKASMCGPWPTSAPTGRGSASSGICP